jgi:hypothetical protein
VVSGVIVGRCALQIQVVIFVSAQNGSSTDTVESKHAGSYQRWVVYCKAGNNDGSGGVTFEEHEHQQREDAVVPIVVQTPQKQAQDLEHEERGYQVVLR